MGIVPEYFKWPGEISPSMGLKFADIPNGLAALSQVPALGWVQMVFFAGIMEGCFGVGEYKTGTPGDFGWKVITSDDPAEKEKKLAAEIANGRLAMMAIIGMFFQDGLTGSAWGDWALYTASPLRASERELRADAPDMVPANAGPGGSAVVEYRGQEVWPYEIGATFPLCDHNSGAAKWDPCGFTAGAQAKNFD